MKRELPYFSIEGAFGGSQEWFTHDWWMQKGGCAAVTATDCSLYFSLYKNLPDAAPQAQKKNDQSSLPGTGHDHETLPKAPYHGHRQAFHLYGRLYELLV